jgi:hypothetical protein
MRKTEENAKAVRRMEEVAGIAAAHSAQVAS